MKITKQEATFQPVTIILESQEEVDTFMRVLGDMDKHSVPIMKDREIMYQLYSNLYDKINK